MLKKICLRLLLLLMLIAVGGGGLGYWYYQRSLATPLSISSTDDTLHIAHGSSLSSIARELKSRGIINHDWPLRLYARLRGDAGQIQAGDYRLKNGQTFPQLYQSLIDGDVIHHSITVIEGSTYANLRRQLQHSDNLKQTLGDISDQALAAKLGINAPNLEGQFLPETYNYTGQDSDFSILKRLHQQSQQALNHAWATRAPDLGIKTPYEALILASIIEKETQLPDERSQVSGVFHRRLKKGMRLQTDPTVIYGITNYDGNITRTHLTTDTPYNTYTRAGLPPTPIALPSKAAIDAAVHPDNSSSLYFVANGNGGHTFSDTYSQHQQAVRAYLKKQRSKAQ